MITKKDWKEFLTFATKLQEYGSLSFDCEVIASIKNDAMYGILKRKTVFDEPTIFILKHPDSFVDGKITKKRLYERIKFETDLSTIKQLLSNEK